MDRPVIAIMYDFDKTLCTKDMQDYGFIPSLELQPSEFWDKANTFGSKAEMDGVLAYLYTMIGECRRRGIALTRESLIENGRGIVLYDGVREWFDRINLYGAAQGVQIEHYVISSGLKEIIEGSGIADKFTKIFACEFLYDEDGAALWPKTAVNYTNKTQFVYRINKGILDISNDEGIRRLRHRRVSGQQPREGRGAPAGRPRRLHLPRRLQRERSAQQNRPQHHQKDGDKRRAQSGERQTAKGDPKQKQRLMIRVNGVYHYNKKARASAFIVQKPFFNSY